MSTRPLNNDRTNYLIWRYLQEHGHAQTAARFQADWGNRDPDSLSFAPYIRTHSLILLLQKGLRYHELECKVNETTLQPFFGPESGGAPASSKIAREDGTTITRKHGRESISENGLIINPSTSLSAQAPAPKRSRRSNGQSSATSGTGRGAKSGDAMDIDETPTKREPARTNSPPAIGTTEQDAAGDTDMEVDSGSNSNMFHSGAHGEDPKMIVGATNSVHAMAPTNANLGSGSGGRAGSEDEASAGAGVGAGAEGAENADGPASAGALQVLSGSSADASQSQSIQQHDNHQEDQLKIQLQQQLEGQVQGQAQRDSQAQTAGVQVQATLIPTLKDGRSVGVQSDKVTDLGPETAVLKVPGKNVTHALWSPRDPALLATAGDALCRLWRLPSTHPLTRSGRAMNSTNTTQHSNIRDVNGGPDDSLTANGHSNGNTTSMNGVRSSNADEDAHILHVDPENVFDLGDNSKDFAVTAMAWSPNGECLGIAKHSSGGKQVGEIAIYSKTGALIDALPGGMQLISNLFWNPSGSLLLGISHTDGNNSTLMVWGAEGSALEPYHLEHAVLDATWRDDQTFMVCGENLVAQITVSGDSLDSLQRNEDLGEPKEWSRICFDPTTQTTAVASETSGVLAIFDPSQNFRTIQAHNSDISALMFQPVSNPNALAPAAPRLLATGDTSGSIKVWDAKRPFELVHSLSFEKASPMLALSFTPDGYLIAAGGWDSVLFWNAENGGNPKAVWDGSTVGWKGGALATNGHQNSENGDVAMTDDETDPSPPSLSWDADGRKIAYGVKEQIAVVSFRR